MGGYNTLIHENLDIKNKNSQEYARLTTYILDYTDAITWMHNL